MYKALFFAVILLASSHELVQASTIDDKVIILEKGFKIIIERMEEIELLMEGFVMTPNNEKVIPDKQKEKKDSNKENRKER